jgi:predicted lipoprotein with Yx(FWY)xxD motif
MRGRAAVIGALLTLVSTGGLLTACGGKDDKAASTTTAAASVTTAAAGASSTTEEDYGYGSVAPPTTAAAAANTTTTAATAAATVQLADTSLGKVLVDQAGMTLYLFTKDTPGQQSTCVDKCLAAWPALTSTTPSAGPGLDASKLSTITRPDGKPQVAYAGWPLYYYAEDAKPGDVAGQGVNKVWFVLDASGTAVGM